MYLNRHVFAMILCQSFPLHGPRHATMYLRAYVDSKDPDQTVRMRSLKSDQSLTESLDAIECMNGEQMPL